MPFPSLAGNDNGAARSASRIPEFLMPASPRIVAWAMRAGLVLTLVPLLAECGPARNQFAPPCPRPAFLGDAANLDIYRLSGAPGGRHDLTDLVLHGRIVGVNGSCKEGDRKNQLATTTVMTVELTRGPGMQGRDADLAVFLAVTDGDTILDKRIYPMHVAFPPNVDRLVLRSNEQSLILPVSPTKSGAAYRILVGFQLTPDQLEQNRQNVAQ
jgi:hypothetical protein